MPDKEIFVLKIVWRKSIASHHRLTQAVQHANLRRIAGDPTWVWQRFSWSTMKKLQKKTINLLNCHDGILSYLQDNTANTAQVAALFKGPSLYYKDIFTTKVGENYHFLDHPPTHPYILT